MFKYNSKILQYQNTSLSSCYCFCYKAFVRLISIFKPFWLSYPNSLSITYMICITVILVLCFFVKIGLWKFILFVLFVKCFKRKLEFFVSLVYTVEKKNVICQKVNLGVKRQIYNKSVHKYLEEICIFTTAKKIYVTLLNFKQIRKEIHAKIYFSQIHILENFCLLQVFHKEKEITFYIFFVFCSKYVEVAKTEICSQYPQNN